MPSLLEIYIVMQVSLLKKGVCISLVVHFYKYVDVQRHLPFDQIINLGSVSQYACFITSQLEQPSVNGLIVKLKQ